MSIQKDERLEIRLPADMMDNLRKIAPRTKAGKPNVSELVRLALQRELDQYHMNQMISWAGRNRMTMKKTREDWDGSTKDGLARR